MLQADDGSWVANFHSQADAEYVIAALGVYHRFHVLEKAQVEPKPVSALPWRIGTHHKFVKTADGYRRRSVVIDPQGREVAHVLTSEDGDFRDAEYLVCAANAYPRLRAALDKALEACRALVAFVDWCDALSRGDREAADRIYPVEAAWGAKRHPLFGQAYDAAREAVEMAERN